MVVVLWMDTLRWSGGQFGAIICTVAPCEEEVGEYHCYGESYEG